MKSGAETMVGVSVSTTTGRGTSPYIKRNTVTHADTDGLLDRCHCGAVAGFDAPYTDEMGVRVRCTECCEQTNWFPAADGAIFDWNLARRAEKEKAKA
jgi:hypothetical protein